MSAKGFTHSGGSGTAYVAKNPHLIVIDPGHGGSDQGAARNGTTEAGLTLDMAKRLRGILSPDPDGAGAVDSGELVQFPQEKIRAA